MKVVDEDQEAFREAFSRRLIETRVDMNLTQEEMGSKLGLKGNTYAKYETRSHFPLYLLPRLIIETEKPFSYWCFGADQTPPRTRSKGPHSFRVVK